MALVLENSVKEMNNLVHWKCTQSKNHGHNPVLQLETIFGHFEGNRAVLNDKSLENTCCDPNSVEKGIIEQSGENVDCHCQIG